MSEDIEKPDVHPRWATTDVDDAATGSANVLEPPDSKKNVGWNAFEPPARQFFNWLGRITYKWTRFLEDRAVKRHVTGEGQVLFDKEDVLLVLYAIDKTDASNYIHAIGYRADGAPSFNVLSNDTLTLGATSSSGLIEVDGAASENIIVYGIMQKHME